MGKVYRGTTEVSDIVRQSNISKVYRGSSEVWSRVVPLSLSGGTVTTVGSDKVHTFTSNGTLTVTGSGTVQLLVVGNGNAGESGSKVTSNTYGGAGGNGGKVIYQSSHTLSEGSYTVTISGTVNFNGVSATTGGGASGGKRISTLNFESNGKNGSSGTSNSISGSSYVYGSGGGGGAVRMSNGSSAVSGGSGGTGAGKGQGINSSGNILGDHTSGSNYGSGGGGGAGVYDWQNGSGRAGASGVVIIRYTPV